MSILWTFAVDQTVANFDQLLGYMVDKGDRKFDDTAHRVTFEHEPHTLLVLKGNFALDNQGHAKSGTIEGFKFFNDGVLVVEASGYSMKLANFLAAWDAAASDPDSFVDYLRQGPMKEVGTNGADNLIGGAFADTLLGKAGSDNLVGRGGKDTLDSGSGSDQMTGGGGADKFVFKAALGSGDDEITDFSHAADTILLDHRIFTKLNDSGQVKAGFFHLGTDAADGNDYLIYDKATGNLWYDRDANGGQAKVLVANLTNLPQDVAANDFLMI